MKKILDLLLTTPKATSRKGLARGLFIFPCLAFMMLLATASPSDSGSPPLPLEQAFQVSAQLFGKDTILLHWEIAPGHYLYRDRFQFKVIGPSNVNIGKILFPPAIPKKDELLGQYQIYQNGVTLPVPLIHPNFENNELQFKFQGCSEEGYCYPPVTQIAHINFKEDKITIVTPPTVSNKAPVPSEQTTSFSNILTQNHIISVLLLFFGFGVLLSFTPCVLPMIPILSGIIVGKQKADASLKSFTLSLVYVLSMAVTYAIFGVLVGYIGENIQAIFQKPWILVLYSGLFILLALSFFGLYQIKLPAKFEARIANISQHQKRGHYLGVAMMGCLATLIISPCVTPALVGVLSYIGKTGNAFLGGIALFFMGLGMGLPLLLIGVAGGKLLPKAGPWMKTLESVFGVLFLAIAIWVLQRILPPQLTLMLWALLLMISSVYLGAFSPIPEQHRFGKLWKGLGLAIFTYGIIMIIGVAQGNGDPLKPLTLNSTAAAISPPNYAPVLVKNLKDVKSALTLAKSQNKPVLLDFYADWCINCQEMEKTTFADLKVQNTLSHFLVVKADITSNDIFAKKLLRYFNVVAPPTLLFFDKDGKLMSNLTLVGKVSVNELLKQIDGVFTT